MTIYKIVLSLLLSLSPGGGATLNDEGVTEGDEGVADDMGDNVKVTLAVEVTFAVVDDAMKRA